MADARAREARQNAASYSRQLNDANGLYAKRAAAEKKARADFATEHGLTLKQLSEMEADLIKRRNETTERFTEQLRESTLTGEAEFNAAYLRSRGKFYDADIAMIRTHHDAQIQAQRKAFDEMVKATGISAKTDPKRYEDMLNAARNQRATLNQQTAQAEEDALVRERSRSLDEFESKSQRAQSLRLKMLDQEAEFGDRDARIKAQRLRIEMDTNAQIRERVRLLMDPKTSEADRKILMGEVASLGTLQNKQLAMNDFRNQFSPFDASGFTARAQDSRFGQGRLESIREQQMAAERTFRRDSLKTAMQSVGNPAIN